MAFSTLPKAIEQVFPRIFPWHLDVAWHPLWVPGYIQVPSCMYPRSSASQYLVVGIIYMRERKLAVFGFCAEYSIVKQFDRQRTGQVHAHTRRV
jgi:hypothetical protein